MPGINFFTPVVYGNQPKSTSKAVLEAADHYFYLGGKRACIIAGRVEHGKEGVLLSSGSSSFLLSALKVASYFTIVIPLLILVVKAVLRYNHQFHLIDPKSELERNVDVAPNIVAKIQQLMPVIERREDNAQIEWLSKRHTGVFRLTEAPHLVFKMHTAQGVSSMINGRFLNGEQQIRNRFDNMIKAKEVCLAHQLDLVTIPQAKMFTVEASADRTLPVIAEESLNIRATESAQEELYRNHAQDLGRTVRQLATFISKTGFSDVIWRNIPVQDDGLQFHGDRRVALIDLEHMEDPKAGILGSWNGSCGLVRCLFSEEQIDAVLAEARQQGIITQQEARDTKARRMEEIRSNAQLTAFYQRNGILENHRKPLAVNLDTLGLNLDEQAEIRVEHVVRTGTDAEPTLEWRSQQVTMRQVAEATIAEINRLIQATEEGESVKGKRYVLLNINNNAFTRYHQLGGYEERSSWLHRIIDALIAKGHLFQLVKVNGHGYFIQA